jgi:hypothetical protein
MLSRLSHLQALEFESIHIFRDVAAEFQRLALGDAIEETWPHDDAEAADQIFRSLQIAGVLATPRWTQGQGV